MKGGEQRSREKLFERVIAASAKLPPEHLLSMYVNLTINVGRFPPPITAEPVSSAKSKPERQSLFGIRVLCAHTTPARLTNCADIGGL